MTAEAYPPRAALTEFSDGIAEVELGGDLAVPALSAEVSRVLDRRPRRLIFDLHAVTFLDIGAIRTLAGAALTLPGRTRPVIRGAQHRHPEPSRSEQLQRRVRVRGMTGHRAHRLRPGAREGTR